MKMLIVANVDPKQPLGFAYPELSKIASGNEPTILSGVVTKASLEQALDAGQFESVHVIGHGANKLLQMADGPVTISWLIRRLKAQRNLRLVFLNSCDSTEMGAEVHTQLQVATITQRPNADDEAGAAFATDFYGSIARGATVNDAFYEARTAHDDTYPTLLRPILMDGNTLTQTAFQTQMVADVKLLTAISNDNRIGVDALKTGLPGIVQQISDDVYNRVTHRFTAIFWLIVIVLAVTLSLAVWHAFIK